MTAATAPRSGRRYRQAAAVAAVMAAVGAAAVGALGLGGAADDPGARPAASTAATTAVERRTLVASSSLEATVDFGAPRPLPVKATGTITWLPPTGTVLARGDEVLRVDDRPVILLYGELPQYRELAAGRAPEASTGDDVAPVPGPSGTAPPAADDGSGAGSRRAAPRPGGSAPAAPQAPAVPVFTGNDVEQFERNLAALGGHGFTVDRKFTAATTAAVKRWQRRLGQPATGRVGLGDIVYADGPVRVAKLGARVGASASEEVVSVSGDTKVLTAKASAADLAWARKGVSVSVELPDGGKATGTVASLGRPSGGENDGGDDSVPVTVTVKDQKALKTLQDGEAVTVTYVAAKRENVLCVPVLALVALVEGGYGLELAEPGRSGFVAVQTGMFVDGMVEVSGPAVTEGLAVRMAQ